MLRREDLTRVLSKMGVVLALVEAVLSLSLLDVGRLVVALVACLVDTTGSDARVSRHDACVMR